MQKEKRYAYTVKDNRVDCTDYIEFFDNLEANECKVISKYLELDSRGKKHYHGSVIIPDNVYRKQLCFKGLHMKLVEEYNSGNWEEYCKKDQVDSPEPDDRKIMEKISLKKLF